MKHRLINKVQYSIGGLYRGLKYSYMLLLLQYLSILLLYSGHKMKAETENITSLFYNFHLIWNLVLINQTHGNYGPRGTNGSMWV